MLNKMINVSLNGATIAVQTRNLLQALRGWQYVLDQSAVAINGEFIPRATYADVELSDGDQIEVVGAVGGG